MNMHLEKLRDSELRESEKDDRTKSDLNLQSQKTLQCVCGDYDIFNWTFSTICEFRSCRSACRAVI